MPDDAKVFVFHNSREGRRPRARDRTSMSSSQYLGERAELVAESKTRQYEGFIRHNIRDRVEGHEREMGASMSQRGQFRDINFRNHEARVPNQG